MDNAALKPSQTFNVSHLKEADFKGGGLRGYSVYRDLGVAKRPPRDSPPRM